MIRVYGTTTFNVKKASKQTRINQLSNLMRNMNSIYFIGTEFQDFFELSRVERKILIFERFAYVSNVI